ncbi:MAG: FAD-dependent oxidoreductase [Acidobacteria bacterium]|nr:MAG: FAD-dependent oxidoreductase [Acidobacteriota bacterium]
MKKKSESEPPAVEQPLWLATTKMPRPAALKKGLRADVCVIGAGIAGMTTAYLLAREGKSVVVLDKNFVGGGETANTTAHLSNFPDATYREIERLHGFEGARLAAESHTAAITQIETIVAEEQIDCDFERLDAYLFLGEGDSERNLYEEYEATRRAGVLVEQLAAVPNNLDLGPCIHFPNQAQFHPLKYLSGLAIGIKHLGGRIYGGTEVQEVKSGNASKNKTQSKAEGAIQVKVKTGPTVFADSVVVATNTPFNDWVTMHTKQAAYRTYAIGATVPPDSIPKALYWDTADPFHYVRLHRIQVGSKISDVLIVGGEDHKTGQADDGDERFQRLAAWARERFPGITNVDYRWSGQIMESMDGLAFIGRNPGDDPNIYIVTGDSGVGITHGTIAGILIRDLILNRKNSWESLYDPSRKTLRATVTFARENLNVVGEYATWITPGEVGSIDEIKPGTGALLRSGLSKIAAYRDEDGTVHEVSAVCTHLGCVVAWNSAEKSWDCPCHGSRFDVQGKVLNGPAIAPLEPHSTEKPKKEDAA